MTEAWQAPVFQISMSADMTRANAVRAQLVERLRDGEAKPTVSDILTKASAAALMRHREVNATFHGDSIQLHPAAHVGMAVATDRGLVVPVIHDADRRTIQEIAQARVDVVGRARSGKLRQEDLDGGTFTVSNLGMYGVEQFVAVLNPPQVAILAVGATEEKPVVARRRPRDPAAHDAHADVRPPRARRGGRLRVPRHAAGLPRGARARAVSPAVWYRVRELDRGRAFYREQLGFEEVSFDAGNRVSLMRRAGMEIGIAEGEPEEGGVAHVDVEDVKAERERLDAAGVEVGIVLELHGTMRLLDVFDPDGNRIQLAQELSGD